MRTRYGYAWGKLYLAVIEMASSPAPLPERVTVAFQNHLGTLNGQNTPEHVCAWLRTVRARLAKLEDVDDDVTIDVRPLTEQEAGVIAEELVSLYDEISKTNAQDL